MNMIYEFDNSIQFLKCTLSEKAKVNPSYSLRAFAKKLGLSAGAMSLILNRKKKLSLERACELAKALDLDEKESEYFLALIQFEGAKSQDLQIQFLEKLKKLNPQFSPTHNLKQTMLSLEHFRLIANWYGFAILELISIPNTSWTVKDIAQKFAIPKIEVEVTLERLEKLELIEKNAQGYFQRAVDSVMINSALPSETIQKYYLDIHEESKKSIKEQTPQDKVIGTQVFSLDVEQLEEVRVLTENYLNSLNELAARGKNKTEIYQAITNVFKLTKGENK